MPNFATEAVVIDQETFGIYSNSIFLMNHKILKVILQYEMDNAMVALPDVIYNPKTTVFDSDKPEFAVQ